MARASFLAQRGGYFSVHATTYRKSSFSLAGCMVRPMRSGTVKKAMTAAAAAASHREKGKAKGNGRFWRTMRRIPAIQRKWPVLRSMYMPASFIRWMAIQVIGTEKRMVTVSNARRREATRKTERKNNGSTCGLSQRPKSAREDILSSCGQYLMANPAHCKPLRFPTAGKEKLSKKRQMPK